LQPYLLNAATLATRGVDTLGGVLQRGLPFDAGSPAVNRLLGACSARTERTERICNVVRH